MSISHLSPRAWQIQSLSQNLKPSQVQWEIPPVQTLCETPEVEACKPASAISDAQTGQVTSVLCLPPRFLLAANSIPGYLIPSSLKGRVNATRI
ncbi:PREDICTED: uncharacterized protein LOC105579545 isoform X3 [Cercocebus atys]|uniref:uncharacterized protein LOC105579545 isoform X3 n=1 Tax=Cercocebus atys TaxID=9531 RepID=UPI0005F4E3B0|nr:PREDICTED: uncharacterized protein LOC105579545 isoform X3 [Cercocebus atys]